MSFTPDAPIMKVKERFPEVSNFDTPAVPYRIRITLNQKIDEARKEEIKKAVLECGFEEVDFVAPIFTTTWYGGVTLTDEQKREVLQVYRDFATTLRNNGIYYEETHWGFDIPPVQKKK